MEHKPEHFITKETAVEPGTAGMDEWQNALDTFFLKDKPLIDYVQKVVASCHWQGYVEALIIAYGEGRT